MTYLDTLVNVALMAGLVFFAAFAAIKFPRE